MRDVLIAIRALLASPDRWGKYHYAVDAAGLTVDPADPRACRWCLLGAIWRCAGDDKGAAVIAYLRRLSGRAQLWIFNDGAYTGHGDVLGLLDRAIAEAA